MERSEPTLVPEWLKGTGNVTGGGSTTHHSALSSLHSDDYAPTLPTRGSRSSVNSSDYDPPRSSAFLDRTSSSYSRRSSSSNGSMMHDKEPPAYSRSYSNFSRSHRERDWEKDPDFREKDRSVLGDKRNRNYSDPLANIFPSRIEKDTLRRSQSMISGKRGETWPRKVAADLNSSNNNNHNNGSGPLIGGSIISSIHKAAFERDFPSLGTEERQGPTDIGRVPSPGLGTASQTLPLGTTAVIGGDGWTSALAEVPVIIGSNSVGLSSVQQTPPASPSATVLNMAETLVQAPSRARTAPQISVETQRLEELALKQSRQLIPMTPSMPKTLVLNPSEKSKPKTQVRNAEMSTGTKIGQQQLSASHTINHSLRVGPTRPDAPKTQAGKLLVLKAPREKNGISHSAKDLYNQTSAVTLSNNPLVITPVAASVPSPRNPNNPKIERKSTALPATPGSSMEKRPTSQAQSRNDFFNLVRKKSSMNLSMVSVPNTIVSSSGLEKPEDLSVEVNATTGSPQANDASLTDPSGLEWSTENKVDMVSNGDACEESRRFSHIDEMVYPDEEEAALLRLLGWEENSGEEEGLTEEEINAFYEEYKKLKPLSKLSQGMQELKTQSSIESQVGSLGEASSGLSASGSEFEA